MKTKLFWTLLTLLWSGLATASQFYIFPVNELDGVSNRVAPESRPMIDKRVRALFTPEVQANILNYFSRELLKAFPDSAVHARQVTDVKKGQYKFIDSPICREGFNVDVKTSFAAVVGLTRGSWYEVERDGGRMEILIPITLNIQLIKPDQSKVVYSISETLYSPFIFSKAELSAPATAAKVSDVVASGLNLQITSLVQTLRTNFKPKDIPITVAGQEQGLLITDQGFEAGFKIDDEPSAVNTKDGSEVLFRVISVDSGYAVLKIQAGKAAKGDTFVFTFASPADDSRKPRVLPVTSQRADGQITSVVAELFSKSIGFKAGFQLSPVDVNFTQTMSIIRFSANCVPWDNYPSTKQIFESRSDAPDFFLKFNVAKSPVARQAGTGGVKTLDSFYTAVSAQIIDKSGKIVYSELANDLYALEKVSGQGLSIVNAEEISLKNATLALADQFIKNVKFENGNFKITAVEKTKFTAEGLSLPAAADPSYEILRPLLSKVNGKPTFLRIPVDKGDAGPLAAGGGTVFSFSKVEFQPQGGDLLRIVNMPRPGQAAISECTATYKAPNSISAEYLIPLIKHASYKSLKFQPGLVDAEFYADSNALLNAGFFKLQIAASQPTEQCIKAGYSVAPQPETCQENLCSMKSLYASTLILEKAGVRVANYVQAETVTFDGFSKPEAGNFAGLRAFESVLKNLPKLTDSSNTTK